MVSAAASARSNLIESKQQTNILENHCKRLSQDRRTLTEEIKTLKKSLSQITKDYDRQGDELLRAKTYHQSEMAKIKIDQLEQNLQSAEIEVGLNGRLPDEIPQIKESEIMSKTETDELEQDDDIDELTLRVEND